ncbi:MULTISPECIES: hypothetical protein [unclassified Streptomyces]|uniref:hypothetical protein n=1 Tax=unclassified Streptomyces TaxID=2593676 RepID=UPI00081DB7F0|nr:MULTISPECIES: hypothetical protein [unclassified Streptomyces]SCD45615.1 hypothetical protein GA0115243_102128 [Streptomyces sp. ScaeMP-e83]
MRRLDKGAPLRAAIKAAGLDIPHLAARTKELDPTGKGLSPAYVGFIAGTGKSAREDCSERAAELIAQALDQEVTMLFEPVFFTVVESTSTSRSVTTVPGKSAAQAAAPLPDQLLDQHELARFLRKSMSWIDGQIKEAKRAGRVWPGLHYVGRSRRFDPREVLAGMREQRSRISA